MAGEAFLFRTSKTSAHTASSGSRSASAAPGGRRLGRYGPPCWRKARELTPRGLRGGAGRPSRLGRRRPARRSPGKRLNSLASLRRHSSALSSLNPRQGPRHRPPRRAQLLLIKLSHLVSERAFSLRHGHQKKEPQNKVRARTRRWLWRLQRRLRRFSSSTCCCKPTSQKPPLLNSIRQACNEDEPARRNCSSQQASSGSFSRRHMASDPRMTLA